MADDADCPVCGGERPVTWMITHLGPVATIRSCEQDFDAALIALLAPRLGVETGWLAETLDTAVDLFNRQSAQAQAQAQAGSAGTKRKPRKKAAAPPPADVDDDARDSVTVPDNDEQYPVVTDE